LGGFVWAALFALVGVVFIGVFLQNRENWWAIIPGLTLLGIGAITALAIVAPKQVGPWIGGGFLFLIGRATSLGVTLAAPSVVMSTILGWSLPVTVLVICIPMIAYTTIGGVQAVAWTDVKQMFIVVFGMSAAVVILLYGILQHVSFGQALHLAGATGRLQGVDFSFNLSETYTVWSAMLGGGEGGFPDKRAIGEDPKFARPVLGQQALDQLEDGSAQSARSHQRVGILEMAQPSLSRPG